MRELGPDEASAVEGQTGSDGDDSQVSGSAIWTNGAH